MKMFSHFNNSKLGLVFQPKVCPGLSGNAFSDLEVHKWVVRLKIKSILDFIKHSSIKYLYISLIFLQ